MNNYVYMELKKEIKNFIDKKQVFTTTELEEYLQKKGFKNYYTRNELSKKTRAYAEARKGTWIKRNTMCKLQPTNFTTE